MTGFDFSSIIVAETDGETCGPDGCLPGEEPAAKKASQDEIEPTAAGADRSAESLNNKTAH